MIFEVGRGELVLASTSSNLSSFRMMTESVALNENNPPSVYDVLTRSRRIESSENINGYRWAEFLEKEWNLYMHWSVRVLDGMLFILRSSSEGEY